MRDTVPANVVDAYRAEAILRTTDPGRGNVVVVGDSTARTTLDDETFAASLAARGRRPVTVSIGGAPTVTFGLLAEQLIALDPSIVLLFVSAPSVSSRIAYERVLLYDVRAAPALFTAGEALGAIEFHLEGAAAHALVLLRHRWAMQRAAAVRLGWTTWPAIAFEGERGRARRVRDGDLGPVTTWVRERRPERYPNPNTRAIAELGRRLRARGTRLVVVESPIHPLFALLVAPAKVHAFRDAIRDLTTAHDATFIAATELPELEVADFEDQAHLSARGRRTMTEALLRRVSPLL